MSSTADELSTGVVVILIIRVFSLRPILRAAAAGSIGVLAVAIWSASSPGQGVNPAALAPAPGSSPEAPAHAEPFLGRPSRAPSSSGPATPPAPRSDEAAPGATRSEVAVSRGTARSDPPPDSAAERSPDAGGAVAATRVPTGGPGIVHVVKQGETLSTIARRYQVTVSALASHNELANPDAIQPGLQLRVPAAGNEVAHVVRQGETLWEIALRYGIDVEAISRHNQLEGSAFLSVGQKLRLPVASSAEPDPVAAEQARETVAIAPGLFRWPLAGRISSGFGPRDGRQHTGIDIAANQGDTVRASRTGTVTVAGWLGGYGLTVVLRHGDGTATLYAHNSRLLVEKGQQVEGGAPIARAGSTGNSTGPHVHFEIIVGTRPQDPMRFLAER